MNYIRYLRNKARLMRIAEDIIDSYAVGFPPYIISSVKKDILKDFSSALSISIEDISSRKDSDTDYIRIAHVLLVHVIDSAMENFHMPLSLERTDQGEMALIRTIFSKCLAWMVEHHYLTPEEKTAYQC